MRSFELRVGIDSLKLKVKFACKITLSVKHRNQEYPIVQEQPLLDGTLTVPPRDLPKLDAEYSPKEDRFPDSQIIVVLLYLHSSHGKLLVGSYQYRLNELTQKKTIHEKIRNSPDKSAEIKLTLELRRGREEFRREQRREDKREEKREERREEGRKELVSHEYMVGQRKSPPPSNFNNNYSSANNNLNSFKHTFGSGKDLRDMSSFVNPTPVQPQPIPVNLKTSATSRDDKNSPHRLLLKSSVSNPNFPNPLQSPPLTGSRSNQRPPEDPRGGVESLKRKLSEVRATSSEGNQKYLERILELQKEVKVGKEKIAQYELDLKLKDNNTRYLEKQLAAKREKSEALEAERREGQKKGSAYQQRIRQLQYALKQLSEQHEELKHNSGLQTRKIDKREENWKEQLSNLNQKYIQLEKERDRLQYKLASVETQSQQAAKRNQEQLKDKDKRSSEDRLQLTKKITQLEKSLAESKQEAMNLLQRNRNCIRQANQAKIVSEKMSAEVAKLQERSDELMIENRKLDMEMQTLEEQLKQEKAISNQIKELQQRIEEKDEEIEGLRRKMNRTEQQLVDSQERVKQLTINIQNLEEQYEKLYFQHMGVSQEGQRRTKTINELIEQNQHMEKTIEKLNFSLHNLQSEHQQQRTQLLQAARISGIEHQKLMTNLKQTTDQLLDERQRRKIAQKQLADHRRRSDDLQSQIELLEADAVIMTQQLHSAKGSVTLLENRIQHQSAQIEELRKLKEEKQIRYLNLSDQADAKGRQKDQQLQQQLSTIEKLNGDIRELGQSLEEATRTIESKDQELNKLQDEVEYHKNMVKQLNQLKADLDIDNSQYKEKVIELYEKIEQLDEKQHKLQKEKQQLDLELTNSPTAAQNNGTHEYRKKIIRDLIQLLESKEKELESVNHARQKLELEVAHLREEERQLNDELQIKREEIMGAQKDREDLQSYLEENLQTLKKKLDERSTEIMTLAVLNLGHSTLISSKEDDLTKAQSLMKSLNSQIENCIQENAQLQKKLEASQKKGKQLESDLLLSKNNETSLNKEKIQLQELVKHNQEMLAEANEDITKLKDKIEALKETEEKLRQSIIEEQDRLQKATTLIQQRDEHIEDLQRDLQHQTLITREAEGAFQQKQKQLSKRLEQVRLQLSEKTKLMSQGQNEKKNRLNILNNNIEQLRKENYDLQTITYAEKSNNTKLNSILAELTSSIAKVEKANNIKTYYMIPIKDLLKKFEQIMQTSDKMYIEFEKKNKKEAKSNDDQDDSQ